MQRCTRRVDNIDAIRTLTQTPTGFWTYRRLVSVHGGTYQAESYGKEGWIPTPWVDYLIVHKCNFKRDYILTWTKNLALNFNQIVIWLLSKLNLRKRTISLTWRMRRRNLSVRTQNLIIKKIKSILNSRSKSYNYSNKTRTCIWWDTFKPWWIPIFSSSSTDQCLLKILSWRF